jgi:hypothetical protein
MTRKLHMLIGGAIALFLLSHLTLNLFALGGPDAHNAALRSVQWLYRNPVIEPLLVAALLFQIGLGIRLAVRRMRETGKSGWARLQLASGFYLAYFIVNHTGAALYTRHFGQLDTNFWWVSGPLLHPVMQGFFYPYYALAVIAVCAHLGSILHFRGKDRLARLAIWGAVPVVMAYWGSFGGWFYPVSLRADYRAYFDGLLAMLGIG